MKKFAVSAAACMIASALYAQENTGFVLLPDNGAGIATTGSFDLSFTENGGSLNFGIFSPLREYDEKNAWLLYDVGVSASLDDDFSPSAYALYGGLVYRYQAQPNVVLGFNAYLEGAGNDASSDLLGLASVGAELDWRSPDKPYFLQAGANYYLPFDDYTNADAYGVLGSAPRQGADAYVSLGRSYEAFDVRGSLAIFDYVETPTALGLNGYRADATIAFGGDDGGPETRLSLGVRDDSRLGVEPALVAGLTMEFQFGGTQDIMPQRDCAIVRDGSELPTIDCDEQVMVLAGDIDNKDGTVNSSPVAIRPLVRVDRPQRHLGFGTPFTPIEYSGASITLIKRTEGADNTFTFTSNATGLSTTITTSGGEGSAPAVEIEPGTYSITETALPAGYSLDTAACSGASVSLPISGGVEITVADGDNVVCIFNNGFTQPTPDPTLQIVKQATGGDETFNFTTDAPGLATSLTTSGGTATSLAVTVTPGTYAITEVLTGLPDGWTFEEASCTGATFSNAANGVNVTLAAGDNAVCTFANEFVEQTGTLQIVKQTTGGDETFNFTTDAPGLATELTTVGGEATSAAVTIAAGTYAITEVLTGLPDGWTFEAVECSGASFTGTTNGVSVTLTAGDAAVCTFENTFEEPVVDPDAITVSIAMTEFQRGSVCWYTFSEVDVSIGSDGPFRLVRSPTSNGFSRTPAVGQYAPGDQVNFTLGKAFDGQLAIALVCPSGTAPTRAESLSDAEFGGTPPFNCSYAGAPPGLPPIFTFPNQSSTFSITIPANIPPGSELVCNGTFGAG